MRYRAPRRPLRDNEVRVERDGVSYAIYSRKHGDWQTYCQLRFQQSEQRAENEAQSDAEVMQEINRYLDGMKSQFPVCTRQGPGPKTAGMYLANTLFGWNVTRVARAFGVHRTNVSKSLGKVEDARDKFPEYDEIITTLEDKLHDYAQAQGQPELRPSA